MKPELGEERIRQRVAILLALKGAYIKAIGQPLGFDYTRLEFDIEEQVRRTFVFWCSCDADMFLAGIWRWESLDRMGVQTV